jgi:oligopeptide/dipeptide ABC transporter ATP-binding protein
MSNAVDGVTLAIESGSCLGLVGESGCGKSLTLKSIIGLLPRGSQAAGGRISFSGKLEDEDISEGRTLRGRGVAMVFQEPMSALNPVMTVGDQIAEGLRQGGKVHGRRDSRKRVVELMDEVGIPNPQQRADSWPHEMSGGMAQRVMIAMALATDPLLLLADEPTTALDVTIQDQILGLLDDLRRDRNLSIILVSHDLAVVRQVADQVAVMYAGRVVETGAADQVLLHPQHPYTAGLLLSTPSLDYEGTRLRPIEGLPPPPDEYPKGCRFAPRCPHSLPKCAEAPYVLEEIMPGRATACIRWYELEAKT